MKQLGLYMLLVGVIFNGWRQSPSSDALRESHPTDEHTSDKEQIQILMQKVLKWSDSKYGIALLPATRDSRDTVYMFDLQKHQQNLEELKRTDMFSKEFIENYNQIILTLDGKLRGGESDEWAAGYLPPFSFANDHSPWCNCQDNLDWDKVEIKIRTLTNTDGELVWGWVNLGQDYHPSWKEFEYRFKVVKENNRWRIAYLEGFDLEGATK